MQFLKKITVFWVIVYEKNVGTKEPRGVIFLFYDAGFPCVGVTTVWPDIKIYISIFFLYKKNMYLLLPIHKIFITDDIKNHLYFFLSTPHGWENWSF